MKKIIKENISDANSITYILDDTDQVELTESFVLDSNIHGTLLNTIKSKYTLTDIEDAKLLGYIEIFKHVEDTAHE
jgi:nitrous oxidase accessory protein NosD